MIAQEVFMDILALHRQGYSYRAIARKLSIHRNTVKKYVEGKQNPTYSKKQRAGILTPFKQIIQDWLEEDDYKATWIFDKIKQLGYPGSYDTVKEFVREVKKRRARLAYLRFETMPGMQAQMDWGVFKTPQDNAAFYAFVMVLGYSRAMYVEFVERCTFEAFLDCHIHAFHFLGGVPTEILYDNMKNVVINRKNGRVNFNIEFVHFSNHYGFTPRACPPYSPWVKGKVERPVDYIRERFWRGYRFDDIDRCNRDVRQWLNQTANSRTHGTHGQPVLTRWQEERFRLNRLPAGDYDTSMKFWRKVYKDCRVSYNGNSYHLPHEVVGKKVLLKVKKGRIKFYYDDHLLATYTEPPGKNQFIENPLFYQKLKNDKEQWRRKFRNTGKTTCSPVNKTLCPQVAARDLREYEQLAGGASWSN